MALTRVPIEYLATSSDVSLESFELTRLNSVSNLRKELAEVVEEWVEAEIQARIAAWIRQHRRADDDLDRTNLPSFSDAPPTDCLPSSPVLSLSKTTPPKPGLPPRRPRPVSLLTARPPHAIASSRPNANPTRPAKNAPRLQQRIRPTSYP